MRTILEDSKDNISSNINEEDSSRYFNKYTNIYIANVYFISKSLILNQFMCRNPTIRHHTQQFWSRAYIRKE